jgi:tRNA 2-thiouridine synthesizing protein D
MASFSITVLSSPQQSGAKHAYQFVEAALAQGHSISRLFFYGDGVFNALQGQILPQDEHHLPAAWESLILNHGLDAVVCIAAALRRGVVDIGEAQRYPGTLANLRPGFQLSGLGQWVEAQCLADRCLTFG